MVPTCTGCCKCQQYASEAFPVFLTIKGDWRCLKCLNNDPIAFFGTCRVCGYNRELDISSLCSTCNPPVSDLPE